MLHQISNQTISIQEIYKLAKNHTKIELSEQSKAQIIKAQAYLENIVSQSEEAVYGVNTGFGYLCNYKIPREQISELQENLVMSHACGMGDEVPVFNSLIDVTSQNSIAFLRTFWRSVADRSAFCRFLQ